VQKLTADRILNRFVTKQHMSHSTADNYQNHLSKSYSNN